ncbi:hypothetical protein [Brucella anthropi]|jgi:hypothetical protein|uniref:hypothetical protein n=1 Tax=Brucella anthropi TaxID=529 RepID=UPI0005BB0ECC|nr:hypothetical protein [Brucella anthropi]KIU68440.1 hypothetical protein TR92_11290 [Brucella anthropi]
MKKIVATAAVLATFVSPALAGVDEDFQSEVMKCWNVPATDGPMPKLIWKVEIDGSGLPIDITASTPKPEGGLGRAIVESLKRAIARCYPYQFPAGVYTITIDKGTFGGKSLDPYK